MGFETAQWGHICHSARRSNYSTIGQGPFANGPTNRHTSAKVRNPLLNIQNLKLWIFHQFSLALPKVKASWKFKKKKGKKWILLGHYLKRLYNVYNLKSNMSKWVHGVVNISEYPLDEVEACLLQQGLNYMLTPTVFPVYMVYHYIVAVVKSTCYLTYMLHVPTWINDQANTCNSSHCSLCGSAETS